MLGVSDVNRCSLCLRSNVNNFECPLLQRCLQQESRQQSDSQPGDGRIAHEQPVIDAKRHFRLSDREFAAHAKPPVRSASITVNDASMPPEFLKRSGLAAAFEIIGGRYQQASAGGEAL